MALRPALLFLLLALAAAPASAEDRIDRIVTEYRARENVPGVVVVAMRGDQVIVERNWGGLTQQSVQPFYSVSKQMTAALILHLARQGRLALDAPVGQYLPEWFSDEPALRVQHLLDHTSGLANFVGRPEALAVEAAAPGTSSLEEMVVLIDRLPRRFAPGARHAYSNSNYTALALIAERISGRAFADAQREILFAPLGLASMDECARLPGSRLATGHDATGAAVRLPRNLVPTFAGNGGICGNAVDLARWTRSLELVRGVLGAELQQGAPVAAGYAAPYGFGLSMLPLAGRPAFSHGGGGDGWGAWAAYLPQEQLTLVVLADRGWIWGTDVGVPILRTLLGIPEPPPRERLPLSDTERTMLTGDFEDGLFDISLVAEADRLILANPPFRRAHRALEAKRRPLRFARPARHLLVAARRWPARIRLGRASLLPGQAIAGRLILTRSTKATPFPRPRPAPAARRLRRGGKRARAGARGRTGRPCRRGPRGATAAASRPRHA